MWQFSVEYLYTPLFVLFGLSGIIKVYLKSGFLGLDYISYIYYYKLLTVNCSLCVKELYDRLSNIRIDFEEHHAHMFIRQFFSLYLPRIGKFGQKMK